MDMIQVFKIIHNIDDVKMEDFFEFSDLNTRGHSKKLVKPRALKSFRQNSFSKSELLISGTRCQMIW